MSPEELGKKIVELSESLDEETIKTATNEELMGYLFLVEKMKTKLEKAVKRFVEGGTQN